MNKCIDCSTELDNIILAPKEIPFRCSTCGALKFSVKPMRDITFIFALPEPESTKGGIYIPKVLRYEAYRDSVAYVLAIGSGYYRRQYLKGMDDDNKKKHKEFGGHFIPTQVKPGNIVVYDSSIMWSMEVKAPDGEMHEVLYCGEQDIKCMVEGKEWKDFSNEHRYAYNM